VYLAVAGANRDPAVFNEPWRLDLNRPSKPGHVAFGQGPHFCLGHALARLEMAVALPAALRRFPRMTLVREGIDWDPLILVRSATELPVALTS
jgi:cytochrome P450